MQKLVDIEIRLATYYANLLKNLNDSYKMGASSIDDSLGKYDLEREQISNSLNVSFNHAYEDSGWVAIAVFFTTSGADIYNLRLHPKEYVSLLEKSLQLIRRFESADRRSEGIVLSNLGLMKHNLSNFEEALSLYQEALELANQEDDINAISMLLGNIAAVWIDIGDMEKSIEHSERSLELALVSNDKIIQGNALINLGRAYDGRDLLKASKYYKKALGIFRELGDRYREAKVTLNLGNVEDALGNFSEAQEMYKQSLSACEKIGYRKGCALAIRNLGKVEFQNHNYVKAREKIDAALRLSEEINDISGVAMSLTDLGNIYLEIGNRESAIEYYERSILMIQQNGLVDQESTVMSNLARVYFEMGDTENAISGYNKALVLAKQTHNLIKEAEIRYNLAILFAETKNYGLAIRYLQTACTIFQETQHPMLLKGQKMLNDWSAVIK